MNKYLKSFLHRGLIFGGFGPLVIGIVYLSLSYTIDDFSVGGADVFIAVISTYILAFVHAGASVFNQIEEWSLARSLFFHFGSLYIVYVLCYIVNSWIPFEPTVLLIFTLVFIAVYFAVWLAVYFSVRLLGKRMNSCLK